MPVIEVDGLPVAYRETGIGTQGTPVLFAHCSLAHSGLWKPMLIALAEARHCVALDMPAHGGTAAPRAGQSLQMFALAACEALALREGRPVHLVGLSLGGAVLGRLALKRPDLVASVTLIEPVWFHLLRANGRDDAAAEEEAAARAVQAALETGGPKAAVIAFMDRWGVPGGFDRLPQDARDQAAAIYTELSRDFAWVTGHPPGQVEVADLAGMKPLTLLMAGALTPRPAIEVIDVIEAAIPAPRRRTIEGAGHLSPVTHWKAVLSELNAFWAVKSMP
jgi:lipase